MTARIRTALRRADDTGASAVEYALVVVAIAAVIVAILYSLGAFTRDQFSATCDSIASAQGAGSC